MTQSSQSPNILVGIDGSRSSSSALEWATAHAKDTGGSVTALMAWSYPTAMMIPMVGAPVLPAQDMADAAQAQLAALVQASAGSDAVVSERVVMGAAGRVLADASAEHDLLIIGRTGQGRIERLLLGSTASYCARHAECPVAIIDESVDLGSTITVAVDGSASSIDALVWAIETTTDHDVLAVYSHDEWELDRVSLDDELRSELDKKADDMLVVAVDEAIERTGVDPDRVRRQVRQGDPRTTIVDQANPDELLVLGAQGHSGLARWALGSLADYAVHHAPGSVVIWRKPE